MISDKLRNKARTRCFPLQYNKSDYHDLFIIEIKIRKVDNKQKGVSIRIRAYYLTYIVRGCSTLTEFARGWPNFRRTCPKPFGVARVLICGRLSLHSINQSRTTIQNSSKQ